MKNIYKLLFFLVCLNVSCSKQDEPADIMQTDVPTRSDIMGSTTSNVRLISPEMVPGILKMYLPQDLFSAVDKFSLKIISEEEKDLIFVVNFESGGWVLISGIQLSFESPILAFSTEGSYDPDAIKSPEAAFWLETTKRTIAELIDTCTI